MKTNNRLRNKAKISPNTSFYSSENSPSSQGMGDVLPLLGELNEGAIDMIHQEMYEDALDSLLKAEYMISVLLPSAKTPRDSMVNRATRPPQIEETYICTVYYNLA